jgi:hypothetical protein
MLPLTRITPLGSLSSLEISDTTLGNTESMPVLLEVLL